MISSFAFFENHVIGIILLILWLIRIFCLKIPHLLIESVVSLLVPILFFVIWQSGINQKVKIIPKTAAPLTLVAKIRPDDLQVNGDSYSGIVEIPRLKQRILVYGFFKNKSERDTLLHLDRASFFTIDGQLKLIDSAPNFSQFDAKDFNQSRGIVAEFKCNQFKYQTICKNLSLSNLVHNLRFQMMKTGQQLPRHLRMYVLGIIYGNRTNDFREELAGVRQLGLIHLFTISGMHVFYLIGLFTWIFSTLRFKRETIDSWLIILLPAYFVIAGAGASLLRAALMAEERLGLKKLNLSVSALDGWSCAVMINLLINPLFIFQFGCQLSYLLSLGLILTNNCGFLKRTILLNLISMPIILYHVYEWHVLSLLANMLFVPFFTAFIFPVVLIGYSLSFFKLNLFVSWIDKGLGLFDQFLNLLAGLPGNLVIGKLNVWIVLVMVITVLFLIEKVTVKRILFLLTCFSLGFIMIHFPLSGEVDAFDVGQGDSFLVREPFNRSITLIDTGGKPNFFGKSKRKLIYQANNTSMSYLRSIGVSRIDNVCLSHQDADHVGDLPAFLSKMNVSRVYVPWGMTNNQSFLRRIKPYRGQFQLINAKAGDHIKNSPFQVVHPMKKGLGENQDSQVLFGKIGGLNWIFMGDLNREEELKIIQKYPHLRVDVIKLGHHGSKTSSDPKFIRAIDPKIALISAGRHNRYHHPNQETIDTMHRQRITIISTQKNGMIRYKFRNNKIGKFETKWKVAHQ
ncbi:DNA internalization-related competence protein ComEC Rec2 [Fructilactobacillus fructivorans]|nr:DNA internalization-related competence protein ComEC Rec2 [Fructilactobacillus fructivorans]